MPITSHLLADCISQWTCELNQVTETPRLEAEILTRHITGFDNAQLITQADQPLEAKQIAQIQPLIDDRLNGKPIAYLTGHKEFYSLALHINESVLIPRPETELLVDTALSLIKNKPIQTILDLGTGSGAIALAIASNCDQSIKIIAVDSSANSLKLAEKNAQQLGIKNVVFIQSDWYTALNQTKFDLIVSNPPYIDPQDRHLQQGDLRFEPTKALVAGDKGLADLAHIIQFAAPYLSTDGYLILEHGFDQAQPVQALFAAAKFCKIKTLKDINGLNRLSLAKL